MYVLARAPRSKVTFRIKSDRGIWRVTRDNHVYAAYWSEGDARRGACLGARRHDATGGAAQVISSGDGTVLRHNELQFGL